MKVKALVEVRGKKKYTNKKGEESVILRVEDIETGEPFEFVDKELERFDEWQRGDEITLILDLQDRGKFGLAGKVVGYEKKA